MSYKLALEKTDPAKVGTLQRGSPDEQAAIERFKSFVSMLSEESVRASIRDVYAQDAYLNDTLKEVNGVDNIEAYFIESARQTESITVEITDLAVSDGNYYFRWIMDVKFKKLHKGKVARSVGMTHVRFNNEGKVVLHQDYWDSASGLFEYIPILGGMIRFIKNRL